MPVITYIPCDPTDLVLQGEQLRSEAFESEIPSFAAVPFLAGGSDPVFTAPFFAEEDSYPPMESGLVTRMSARRMSAGPMYVRLNAGIATTCGAWLSVDWTPLLLTFVQSTVRWLITGVTRDSTGVALGGCRVVALDVGRLAKDGAPIVAEMISDGSGNYSLEVGSNSAHQVLAYKPGSPDVGGVSLNTVLPVAV